MPEPLSKANANLKQHCLLRDSVLVSNDSILKLCLVMECTGARLDDKC